jgi:hypothetical protein
MRPRFSIRDLLWLTLVIGVCVGWYLEHRRWTNSMGPKSTTIYYLKYGNAANIGARLSSQLQNTHCVEITADTKLNAIFLAGDAKAKESAEKTIEQLDKSPPPLPNQ